MKQYTEEYLSQISRLSDELKSADAVLIGAGAGLSAAAGLSYSGERFNKYFSDFHEKYGIRDMYEGGFYPFKTPAEFWAWWSRSILVNRYEPEPTPLYNTLLELVKDKDYFVLTTNVDHQFQRHGFDKERLCYMQGDYGLWQCSEPCCQKTYDNEKIVRRMIAEQKDMRIPDELIPRCPVCGKPMTTNLRCDGRFVQDEGWHKAQKRYNNYLRSHKNARMLLLELGVGMNTPGIIKLPFWQMAYNEKNAFYASVSLDAAYCPREIADKSVCLTSDIKTVLDDISAKQA